MDNPNDKALGDFFGGAAERRQAKQTAKQAAEQARLEKEAADAQAWQRALEERRQSERAAFPDYFAAIAPIVAALESLPPRDGREFFVRVDLNPNGKDFKTNVRGPALNLWALYTCEADAGARNACPPRTQALAIDGKGAPARRIDLEVNELPVLRMRGIPLADGTMKIQTEHYTLEFINTGKRTQGRGSYRSGSDGNMYQEREQVSERRDIGNIREMAGFIGGWVEDVAPERLEEVRKALSGINPAALAERIAVSKPLTFRKDAPPAP